MLAAHVCHPHMQVRGKTVYLQYSTRNEIVNAGGGGGERPSNCLLVTLENLDVRIRSPFLSHASTRDRPGTIADADLHGTNTPHAAPQIASSCCMHNLTAAHSPRMCSRPW